MLDRAVSVTAVSAVTLFAVLAFATVTAIKLCYCTLASPSLLVCMVIVQTHKVGAAAASTGVAGRQQGDFSGNTSHTLRSATGRSLTLHV